MFVGVSPGWEDDAQGIPWTGPTGNLFRDILIDAGIKFSEIYTTNAVRCATDGDPKASHFAKCREHLIREINEVRPKALVAIGGAASTQLIGKATNKIRKKEFSCVLVPGLKAYAIPQPAILFHQEGIAKERAREEMVEDLAWIKQQVLSGGSKVLRPQDYKIAKTLADVDAFLEECTQDEAVAFDFETNFLGRPYPEKGHHIAALGLSKGQGHGRIIPVHMKAIKTPLWWSDEIEGKVKGRLHNYFLQQLCYGHNAYAYDDLVARVFLGVPRVNVDFDTMLAQYCLDEEPPHGLEHVALRYTPFNQLWKDKFNLDDPNELARYLFMDVDATSQIRAAVEPKLVDGLKELLTDILLPTGRVLTDMQYRGVAMDRDYLKILRAKIKERLASLTEKIRGYPEVLSWELSRNKVFNIGSPDQLGDVMKHFFKFPEHKKTATGKYCTDDSVLEKLKENPFCGDIITYRKTDKIGGTYVESLDAACGPTGLVHTSFKMITKTGRLSSEDPALQTLPRKASAGDLAVKPLIVPRSRSRCFIQLDYKQAELRVWASLSGDKKLTEYFAHGWDPHKATASDMLGKPMSEVTTAERDNAKRISFGVIYGKQVETLVRDFLDAAEEEARKAKRKLTRNDRLAVEANARKFFALHQQNFKEGWDWLREQERIVLTTGVQITPFGRRRRHRKSDHSAVREAQNAPIQANSNDVCLTALRELDQKLPTIAGADAYLVLTVHDSIVAECEMEYCFEVAQMGYDVMTGIKFDWMKVPMEVDVEAGLNYGELKKLDLKNRTVKD